jgi:hypothetical protein
MSLKTKAVLLLTTLFLLGACKPEPDQGETLASRIQYDVPIVGNDPQLDWWVNNLEGSRRDPFVQRLISAAEKGDIKAYDYFNQPLSPDQVLALGTDTVYMTFMREFPPYEEYDTMVVRKITYRDVTKIRFLEEWTWDPGSLEVRKKVIGIGPLIQKEMAGQTYNQLLFWVYVDKDYRADQN